MVRLGSLTAEQIQVIWKAGQNDPYWPFMPPTFSAFEKMAEGYETAEFFAQGAIRSLLTDGTLDNENPVTGGFVIFNVIPEHFVQGRHVVECGTFLIPQWRGTGVHHDVKTLTMRFAFDVLQADDVAFVIPDENAIAKRAIEKLPFPFLVSSHDMADPAHSPQSPDRFAALRKRKSWEIGKPCTVYTLTRAEDSDTHAARY